MTREAKTLRLRVNAIIRHVRSRFGSSRLEVPQAWPAENDGSWRRHHSREEKTVDDRRCDPWKGNRL